MVGVLSSEARRPLLGAASICATSVRQGRYASSMPLNVAAGTFCYAFNSELSKLCWKHNTCTCLPHGVRAACCTAAGLEARWVVSCQRLLLVWRALFDVQNAREDCNEDAGRCGACL